MLQRIIALCAAALACTNPAYASGAGAWDTFEFRSYDPIEYSGDDERMDIRSEEASSLYYRQLSTAEREAEMLEWSWKVDQSNVTPTRMDVKKGDDRLLALYVFFTEKPYSGSSIPRNGKFLAYVWGSSHAEGDIVDIHNERGKFVVLREHATPHGTWYKEAQPFKSDFKKAFGFDAHPAFIAVIADTDDTGALTKASIQSIRFE